MRKEWLDSMKRAACEPNAVTFGAILRQCGRRHELGTAERLWLKMAKCSVEPNSVLFNTFLDMYAAARQPIKAEGKFQDMVRAKQIPDIQTFGSLVKAAARAPDLSRARLWLERSRRSGEAPDARTFASLLSACAQVGDIDEGYAILQQMELHGIPRNVVTYTSLIRTCAAAGDLKEAEQILEDMKQAGIRPNSFTINAVMTVCESAQQPLSAERLYSSLAAKGAEVEIVGSNSLLQAWAKEDPCRIIAWLGRLAFADVKPDVISYNLLMNSAAKVLDKELAEWAWSELKALRLRPTLASYRAISKVLARHGDYNQLSEILNAAAQLRPRDAECERAFISACANAKPKAAKEAEDAFMQSQHLLRDDARAVQALRLAVGDSRYFKLRDEMKLSAHHNAGEKAGKHQGSEDTTVQPISQPRRRPNSAQFIISKTATDFSIMPDVHKLSTDKSKNAEEQVVEIEVPKDVDSLLDKAEPQRVMRSAAVLSDAPETLGL